MTPPAPLQPQRQPQLQLRDVAPPAEDAAVVVGAAHSTSPSWEPVLPFTAAKPAEESRIQNALAAQRKREVHEAAMRASEARDACERQRQARYEECRAQYDAAERAITLATAVYTQRRREHELALVEAEGASNNAFDVLAAHLALRMAEAEASRQYAQAEVAYEQRQREIDNNLNAAALSSHDKESASKDLLLEQRCSTTALQGPPTSQALDHLLSTETPPSAPAPIIVTSSLIKAVEEANADAATMPLWSPYPTTKRLVFESPAGSVRRDSSADAHAVDTINEDGEVTDTATTLSH